MGLPLVTILRRRRRLIDRALRLAFVVVLVLFTIFRPVPAGDAHAYWAVDLVNPYSRPIATPDAFTYPPPAALFFSVLGHLPFEVFEAGWTLLIGAALLWLTGPFALLFLVLPVVASDLYLGNIHVLLGAAVVGSLRRPGLWAIPLLTKPTVGVGLLWFAVRGEWRRLATAIGVTAVIAAAAFVIAPDLWKEWIDYVLATGVAPNVGTAYWVPIPLLIRLPAAALARHLGRPHEPPLDAPHRRDARPPGPVARRPGDARRRLRPLTLGPPPRPRPGLDRDAQGAAVARRSGANARRPTVAPKGRGSAGGHPIPANRVLRPLQLRTPAPRAPAFAAPGAEGVEDALGLVCGGGQYPSDDRTGRSRGAACGRDCIATRLPPETRDGAGDDRTVDRRCERARVGATVVDALEVVAVTLERTAECGACGRRGSTP